MPTETVVDNFIVEFSTKHLPSENAAAYFEAVSEVLQAFQSLDANLLSFILPEAHTRLGVEKIEIASLRLWLAAHLEDLPEEGLRKFEWKLLAGHYLLKGRNALVRFLRKNPKVSDKRMIEDLGQQLDSLANELLPSPKRFPRRLIITILVRMIRATQSVPGDEIVQVTIAGETNILPRDAEVTPVVAEEIAAEELEPFDQEMKLLVKKPDMLGRSQWEFMDRGHVIRAKMTDIGWVKQYQQQDVMLKPGDALEAKVRVTPRGSASDADYAYEVVNVRRVLPSSITQQTLLFDLPGAR